jgi:hypothetical protein
VDLDRLTLGERIVGVGAVVLVAASFLHWLGGRITTISLAGRSLPVSHYEFAHRAWAYAVTAVAVVTAIGMLVYLALLVLMAPSALARVSPISLARPLAAFGVLTFLLVALKVAVGADVGLSTFGLPSTSGIAIHVSFTKTRQVGAYVGLIASAAIAGGAILNLREAAQA